MIARIAVASAVFSMDKPFDYRIPDSLTLQPGQRVRVPFGASNRRTEGIVLAVMPDGAERPDGPALKPVEAALDPEPLLSRAALHLAAFVRERYFCTFYDAVRAILPAGVWFQPRDRYTLAENAAWDDRWRNPAAQAVFQTLQTLGGAAEELLGHVPAVLRDDLAAQALGGTAGRGQAPQLLRADGDAGVFFEQAFVLGQLVGLAVVAAAHTQETGAHE